MSARCPECEGKGWYISVGNEVMNPCPICGGTGYRERKAIVTTHTGTMVEADPGFAVQVDRLAEAVTRLGWAKDLEERDQAERKLVQVVSEYQDWKEGEA